jgi:molybdenum-dependent DNA-binding transcriptional regulator ModE
LQAVVEIFTKCRFLATVVFLVRCRIKLYIGETMTAFEKLMAEFGSIKNLCQILGVKYVTAYAWKMRNGIPAKWHQKIVEASEGRITEQDLG